jgi:acyl-CoA thioesterase I
MTLTDFPVGTSRSTPRRILTGPAALVRVMWTSLRAIIIGELSELDIMQHDMGQRGHHLKTLTVIIGALAVSILATAGNSTPGATLCRISVLGDSLTASYGIPVEQGFPAQLERALKASGHDCEVLDAGVSGDTTAGGLARLDWMLADEPSHVILELGANDGLRALPTDQMEDNLDQIIRRLDEDDIPVLLAGMLAPPNLGRDYGDAFAEVFEDLAKIHDIPLYPFFLDGVAGVQSLNQPDQLHPRPEGVAVIVERIMPVVTRWLEHFPI